MSIFLYVFVLKVFWCFAHNSYRISDLDQTWWEFFPGVSRSFLNSSGTKITAQNHKNIEFKILQKQFPDVLTRFHDSRPFQLAKYTVLHQESDFQVEYSEF